MKNTFKKGSTVKAAVAGFLFICSVQPCFAESLYEYYLSATPATLQQETSAMGQKLGKTFDQHDIETKQQSIDFAEYYSNLQKMILYGTKLGSYGNYKDDLQFARDREVVQSLHDSSGQMEDDVKNSRNTRRFADSKFARLETNVEEEIDTYVDMIKLSLDGCETLITNDLTGFTASSSNHDRIRDYLHTDTFQAYTDVASQLQASWPDLGRRINNQVQLWQMQAGSSGTPLVDPNITGAFML